MQLTTGILAQWIEQRPSKSSVAGSSPADSAIFLKRCIVKYRWTTTTTEIARALLEHKRLTKNELIEAVLKNNRSMLQHTIYVRVSELEKKRLIVKFGENYQATMKFADDYIKNTKLPVGSNIVDLLVLNKENKKQRLLSNATIAIFYFAEQCYAAEQLDDKSGYRFYPFLVKYSMDELLQLLHGTSFTKINHAYLLNKTFANEIELKKENTIPTVKFPFGKKTQVSSVVYERLKREKAITGNAKVKASLLP